MFDEEYDFEAYMEAMEYHYEYLRECGILEQMEKDMAKEVQQKVSIQIGGE